MKILLIIIKIKNVKFEKFPTKKDETDTELCIYLAKQIKGKRNSFYRSFRWKNRPYYCQYKSSLLYKK